MNLSGELIIFFLFAFIAVTGGILLLTLKKVMHMVLAVVFTFISIAGLYVLLSAEFLAAVQLLIYSGAITIMILFGIMLTKKETREVEKKNRFQNGIILIGIVCLATCIYLGIYNIEIDSIQTDLHQANTEKIGIELYSKYIIPFEVTSILLLVALMGAVIIAKKDETDKEEKRE